MVIQKADHENGRPFLLCLEYPPVLLFAIYQAAHACLQGGQHFISKPWVAF
jgi:hypothetical protein